MIPAICTAIAIIAIVLLWVVLYDTHHFVVVRHSFSSNKVRKSTRLVMLSDLHNYQYGKENIQLIKAIEKEKPDMIVLAGDMITADYKEKFTSTMELLKRLKENYPIYYAYGNHEEKICLYKQRYGYMGDTFLKELKEIGIEPFYNAHAVFNDRGIALYGLCIEYDYYQRFTTKPMPDHYLEGLIGKADENYYDVLLAHNPEYFPKYAVWGADLVLSGHIHGGIVRLPFLGGVISPSIRFFPKYDGGLFQIEKTHMVLGRGIGTHKPSVRVFNPAELIVVDLEPET
ncbi:MAG TPA: metallophosphoesterase [Lachnospiraceae bacterium]|nr:metallophosphoesterase [Lachnospiraceae bacterium]